jgi:hypothetical protein
MNKKLINVALVITLLLTGLGLTWYFVFVQKPEGIPAAPAPLSVPKTEEIKPTNEIALSLLKDKLLGGECLPGGLEGWYDSCAVNISKENNQWVVSVTYDGLHDDSISAERITADIIYNNGQWFRGEILRTQKCWYGRGHQDFSVERCI